MGNKDEGMRIIARARLRNFWLNPKYSDAEEPLKAWFDEVKNEMWKSTQDVKSKYRNASFIANNRVVFNIHGNKYRLIVAIRYDISIVFIKFIGTHKQYDDIDASSI
jgi:mRNA interferase HigB